MAKFSQALLQGLLNPAYQGELMQAAKGFGQTPGLMAAERQKSIESELLDNMISTSSQGVASAQQGDVSAVTRKINELRELMAGPNVTLDQKREVATEIQQLQKMVPGAQQQAISNKAQALIRAEEALEDPALDETIRKVLEQRIKKMKEDPEALEQYNEYRINKWRADKSQQEMESAAWVQSNGTAIVKAIQDSDLDALDKLSTEAAEQDSYEAFQQYVATTTENIKTRDYLETRSTEKTNQPNLNYDAAIEALPTDKMQKSVRARYDAYKQVVDQGWNEKTKTWNESLRVRANVLERELKDSLYRMQDSVSISDFRETNAIRVAQEDTIQKLQLQLEEPIRDIDITRRLSLIAKDSDKPTIAEKEIAEMQLRREQRNTIINSIRVIDPEYAEEKYPPREITEDISMYSETDQATIRDAAQEYPERKVEDIILALRRKNFIKSASPEMTYIERVRSKISPMGTYTRD